MNLLAALLGAAFLASALASGAWWDIPASALLEQGASFGPAIAGGESWRLLSAMFLHGGLLHLLFNVFALLEIGHPLQQRIGRPAALTIFFLAGAWGFLASLLWHADGISVGASGGIFGLLGAWAVTAQIAASAHSPTATRFSLYLAVLLTLGLGFLLPNVDNAAHVGGLSVGLLLGWTLKRPGRRRPIFFASCLLLAAGLGIACQQLPAEWQIEYTETQDYTRQYHAFASEDRAISAALQAIGEASRNNQLSDQDGLARLDQELLPRLARLAANWRATNWQTPRLAGDAARWATYTQLRLDAVTALRDAIAAAEGEPARRELERFERLMIEAAQLASEPEAKSKPPAAGAR